MQQTVQNITKFLISTANILWCLCYYKLCVSFGWSNSSGLVHLFSGSEFNPALPEFPPAASFDSALSRLLWDPAEILQIYWSQMVLRATQFDILNHLQPQNPSFTLDFQWMLSRPLSFLLHISSGCFFACVLSGSIHR